MIQVLFKNLDRSEIAREAAHERIDSVLAKFPDLRRSKVVVTLEMENSPHQPGPDLFTVKLHVPHGKYAGVTISKSEPSLYVALADVADHLLEKLNRSGDRRRVKRITQARHWRHRRELSNA